MMKQAFYEKHFLTSAMSRRHYGIHLSFYRILTPSSTPPHLPFIFQKELNQYQYNFIEF